MHLHVARSLPLLVGLCSLALATKSESQKCYTVVGSTSASVVPTQIKTVHETVTKTVIRNIHPHTTVTPDPTTSIVSETTTITETDHEPQQTDTAYETTTESFTTTTTLDQVTETSSSTTSTTTTTTSTTTINPPPEFTPVLDTLPGAGASNLSKKRRNIKPVGSLVGRAAQSRTNLITLDSKKKFPQKVMCVDIVDRTVTSRITHTRPGVITKTAATPTIVTTTTESETTTSTDIPEDASTTITMTSQTTSTVTESPTTTTTTTTTLTDTAVIPGPTIYSACQPASSRNFAGAINGQGIGAFGYEGAAHFVSASAPSAQNCCTQCHSSGPTCGASAFHGTGCLMIMLDPSNLDVIEDAVPSSSFAPDAGYVVSNGPHDKITQNHY